MIKSLKDNPILAQQMSHARWPSPRTARWIAIVLTVVGLILTVAGYAISPDGKKGWAMIVPGLIWLTESLLVIFGPLLTAVVAVVMTVRAIDSENYQMLRLSQLSERDIVNGHLAGAVFRLRSLWAAVGGLVLPLTAALTYFGVFITIQFTCPSNLMQSNPNCTPPAPSEIIMDQAGYALIATVCYVALFIVWNWLAITLGAWVAFRYRQLGKGLSAALVPLILVMVTTVLAIPDLQLLAIIIASLITIVLGLLAHRKAVKYV